MNFWNSSSLVAAANPRLSAFRQDAISNSPTRDLGGVASVPVTSVCPGIVPGTCSSPGVVRSVLTQIRASLIGSQSYHDGQLGGCPVKMFLMPMGVVPAT
jgi:hypothetical protein